MSESLQRLQVCAEAPPELTHARQQVLELLSRGAPREQVLDALTLEWQSADAARQASASLHRFLAQLAAQTQPLTQPEALMAVTARLLAEYLAADRCAYASVLEGHTFVVSGDFNRGMASMVGAWPVAAFGSACVAAMDAGLPYVVTDSEQDPRVDAASLEAYRATRIRAAVCVPLHKQGRLVAAMAVHQATPRVFSPAEIDLVAQVAARCWEALERIRVTATLREAEAAERQEAVDRSRLDYAVRLSGVGFWYCPLPFDQLHWDERVKQHFFLPPDARVTIEDFYARIHPEDREPTRRAIDHSVQARTSYDTVYRTVDPATGAVRWIRALGGTAYGDDGTPTNFDGVTVDVSEQRLVQEKLGEALAQLREQDRRKDEFLATLAHELRNPLAPIRTGLHVLKLSDDEDRKTRTREMMERQLRHLVRMVDDLLDISRITLGKVELRRERLDLRVALHSALETTRPLFEARGHELLLQLPEQPLLLDMDPTRFTQVLANLFHNAAKFTPPGGRVQLQVEVFGEELVLRLVDNGVGIPPEMQARIFDMFTQVGRSTDHSQGGLGIGLTLVRRIVAMHGGTIEVHSAGNGCGTTFTLRLPLAPPR